MADASRSLRPKLFRAPEIFEMEEMGRGAGMAGIKELIPQTASAQAESRKQDLQADKRG